jgi:proteic killer suppression protein
MSAMILSYRCKHTEALLASGDCHRDWRNFARIARRKLLLIDSAQALHDLKVPPGNRLEALRGDRSGQHAIRVNDQYRVCFVWRNGDAYQVEIVDYH